MAQERTPVDEVSGLPLLIVPDDRVLPILHREVSNVRPDNPTEAIADLNHVYHPGKWVTGLGPGGDALRNARVQLVMRLEQHVPYHAYYSGPPLPKATAERFKHVVLSAAGYIPMKGIVFHGEGASIVQLSEAHRERLRTSGEVKVAALSVIQHFMRRFVLEQPMHHIKPRTIGRFLRMNPEESLDSARKYNELTHLILSLVIDQVEESLFEPYIFGHNQGLLAPDAPPRPDDFVRAFLLHSSGVASMGKRLAEKLHVHMGSSPARRLGKLATAT